MLLNDSVVQLKSGKTAMPGPLTSFEGLCLVSSGTSCAAGDGSTCSCLPPDTNGEAGINNQYVQMVNTSFAVYNKTTGARLSGPTPLNQLWSQGECASHNDGDPVVLYDQLAGRWVLTQFISGAGGADQNGECIAVSTSGDATGTYYLYTFLLGATFHDYPKLGVWPDAYYMTTNEFPPNATLSQGVGAFAFDRAKMLVGNPTAGMVFFDTATFCNTCNLYAGQLPSDIDGRTLPPAGSPNYFMQVDDPYTLPAPPDGDVGHNMRIFEFHVDWATPGNSTYGVGPTHLPNATLDVATFLRLPCAYGHPVATCIPQRGATGPAPVGLDALDDRLMFRLAYRNFGDHEALVVTQSAGIPDPNNPTALSRYGVRWYEVRDPGGSPTVYNQGTYAPVDTPTNLLWRWMGSAAMDHDGNMAVGFSASGDNDYPTIRYAGRLATDPPSNSDLTQSEVVVPVTGHTYSGPETEAEGRWGDYSDMTIDPANDCTFWYTTEYLDDPIAFQGQTLLFGTWRTRIASFRFPSCVDLGPTAAKVLSFSSRWVNLGVGLTWRTAAETGIAGFNVWRSSGKGWRKVNNALVAAKQAGSAVGASYRLVDRSVRQGRFYTYRLQVVDMKGKRSWYGAGSVPVR